jgi:hypothetical protein
MKGKDRLDDFIRTNRNAFDDKEPPHSVWDNIQSSLHSKATTRRWWNELVIWRAAAVFFFALSAYLLIPGQKQEGRSGEGRQIAMKEFNDVEAYYFSEISQKVELIESMSEDDTAGELTPDFQRLEAMYLVLKEEMKNSPSREVKDALVLNLLVRIDLLNQQLHKLEDDYEEGGDNSNSEI